ncbi:ATP-dependent RNA helicase ddx51 [Lambiella insularis]|nr:ATP-dependent RNA helicase ddx51 [Lambiella insularis]
MAAQFYARYVPPAKVPTSKPEIAEVNLEHTAAVRKKRKRDSDQHNSTELPVQVAPRTHADGSGNDKIHSTAGLAATKHEKKVTRSKSQKFDDVPHKKSEGGTKVRKVRNVKDRVIVEDLGRDDNREQTTVNGAEAASAADNESKHKKIRSKFEKSSKIAEQLSKKKKSSREEGQDYNATEVPSAEKHGLVPLPQPPEIADDPDSAQISVLPDWLAKPIRISPSNALPFQDLSLSDPTVATLAATGYSQAFAIQTGVLPLLLPGPHRHDGDLCISTATGSGKTLAYILPMVESIRAKSVTKLRGLIVVPTRELVTQVRETLQLCITGTHIMVGTAVGSKTLKEEQNLLVSRGQKYDPRGYRDLQLKRMDGEDDLMNWNDDWDSPENDADVTLDYTVDYTSKVDILVCTPGRLVDHIKSTKGFTLDYVQWLVIDEADRLLDESFQQWIDIVLPALHVLPKRDNWIKVVQDLFRMHETRDIQKVILSATINRDISKLMALHLKRPRLVVLDGENTLAVPGTDNAENQTFGAAIHQADVDLPFTLKETAVPVKNAEDKPLYLLEILSGQDDLLRSRTKNAFDKIKDREATLKTDLSLSSSDDLSSETTSSGSGSDSATSSSVSDLKNRAEASLPFASSSTHGTLIFTNNNENALRLARLLALLRPVWGPQIGTLTKSTATSTGRKTLAAFRKRKISVLIASDRASRGLDIEDLAQVVNYDMPTSLTSYVHRVGRTARAGKSGVATTLVAHHEARWFWNEIARSKNVRRVGRIARLDKGPHMISEEDQRAYQQALRALGQEARGEKA